jgi:bacillithiol biosynthesis deacetylase BshB1
VKSLDFLLIGAHPDDIEIGAGGLILMAKAKGLTVGVIDLTRGEMGTRGDAETRASECRAATALLDLDHRENLDMGDGRLEASLANRETLAATIARLRPRTVVGHLPEDPHPDHAASGRLLGDAWFLSGLQKLLDAAPGGPDAYRPARLLRFLSNEPPLSAQPSVIVDIGDVYAAKREVLSCYSSQLVADGSSDRGEHFVSRADILARVEINARYWGSRIGVQFGEPLYHHGPLPADALGLLRS